MKIALHGYGKIGKLVDQIAQQAGHEILPINRKTPREDTQKYLQTADLAIDFSSSEAVPHFVDLCIQHKKNLVIGTTGWDAHLEPIKKKVLQSGIGCIYSPNFSIGVALFKQIVAHAANILLKDYDISGIEYHHKQKADAPSGTAKALSNMINSSHPNVDLNFSSIRCGHIPGTHTIIFDGEVDSITMTHEARNRMGFAHGALRAAEWIQNKKGFYIIDDFIREINSC